MVLFFLFFPSWILTYASKYTDITEIVVETDANETTASAAPAVCEHVVAKHQTALLRVVNEAFRYKPFIVFESELNEDAPMARMFFNAVGLGGKHYENTEDKKELWLVQDYKNKFRRLHNKRRCNVQLKITRTMESECLSERHETVI